MVFKRATARRPSWYGNPGWGDRNLSAEQLLLLMHFVPRGSGAACRPFVVAAGGYDWAARPPRPADPGPEPFVGRRGPYGDFDVQPAYLAYYEARRAFRDYDHDWPKLSRKVVRRMLRRGWLAEAPDGTVAVTPVGRGAWHLLRFGRPEGSPPRRVGRKKRRPQGAAILISLYRWQHEGRGRRSYSGGGRWRPKGHCVHEEIHARSATLAAFARAEAGPATEPAIVPDRRRKGWKRYKAARDAGGFRCKES